MRIDTYTKVVLTIIAGCLVWLCVAGAPVMSVSAQGLRPTSGAVEVVLVGVRGERTVVPVRPTGDWYQAPLPVEAPRGIPARLVGIERGGPGRWDPVDVKVMEQGRKTTPGH